MGISDSGISGERAFPSTSWSVILHAKDPGAPDYARHLGRLVELYWRPVYGVIRGAHRRTHDEAKDLTQEFFATVVFDRELLRSFEPTRGSFRALLRTALGNFMRDTARDAARIKRGGGAIAVSIDAVGNDPGMELPDGEGMTPDQLFDAAWAETVMTTAVARLEARLKAEGKTSTFEVFRRYDLEGAAASASYADLGVELGLTAIQVKHALTYARGRFRDVVTDLVRGYVDDPADLAAELRNLFGY